VKDAPAFPIPSNGHVGLTKREYFAGLAMQAHITRNGAQDFNFPVACMAIEAADALLRALDV